MKTGQAQSWQLLSMQCKNYMVKPCLLSPATETYGEACSATARGTLFCTDLLCITRDSAPSKMQYLESWLMEEAEQIPRACWTDKDATVKQQQKPSQPELHGLLLWEPPTATQKQDARACQAPLPPAEPAPNLRPGFKASQPLVG